MAAGGDWGETDGFPDEYQTLAYSSLKDDYLGDRCGRRGGLAMCFLVRGGFLSFCVGI